MDSNIQIAIISDANYIDFAAIALASVLDHHPGGDLTVNFIHPQGMREPDFAPLLQCRKLAPFEFRSAPVDPQRFARDWGISKPTWWRCEMPSLCPHARRIIYLDCDLVVLDDIAKMWNEPVDGAVLGAVGDRVGAKVAPTLGLSADRYFNAGVLLMDLEAMRQLDAEAQMRRTLRERRHDLRYADQDLLNLCFAERTRLLHQRWNIINSVYRNPPIPGMYSVEEVKEALANPGIVHFTGHHKPWLFWKTVHHPYAERFWHFAKMAPCSRAMRIKMFLKQHLMNIWAPPKKTLPWDKSILKRQW